MKKILFVFAQISWNRETVREINRIKIWRNLNMVNEIKITSMSLSFKKEWNDGTRPNTFKIFHTI